MNKQFLPDGMGLPAAIFVLGLCLAIIAGLWRQNEIRLDSETLFKLSAERVSTDVATRFLKTVGGLNGLKGMYAARANLKRAEFRNNIESRYLPEEFPGVRGFGFIERVMRPDLNSFLARERADGAPLFAIRQFDERQHEDLYVIKLIEPAVSNSGVAGLDIGSESLRRTAIGQAIASGKPTMTGALTLVQDEGKTPGVLLFVPVYARGAQPATLSERRAALLGLLYSPIVIRELLAGIPDVMQGNVDIALSETNGTLLYDTWQAANPGTSQHDLSEHHFVASQALMIGGRTLRLQVSSTPRFDKAIDHSTPWMIFAGIALLSALLALLMRQQATGRLRAELLAMEMTQQLRHQEARSRDFSRSSSDWFWETDAEHRFCNFFDKRELVDGVFQSSLLGRTRRELMALDAHNSPEMIAAHQATLDAHLPFRNFEYQVVITDGSSEWISASGVPHVDAKGLFAGYRGTASMITERKQAEEARMALTRAIEQCPVSIMVTDARAAIQYVNPKFEKITGYRPDEVIGENPRILSSHEKSPEEYQAMWATLLGGQTWQGEFHNRRKDGTLFWEQASISPVFNDRGVLINFVAIKEDVTQLKKISRELAIANTELSFQNVEKGKRADELVIANTELSFQNVEKGKRADELVIANTELAFQNVEKGKRADELAIARESADAANIAKSRFLATMSHEIRTPMNGILGMAQMLLMPNIKDDERQDYARIILNSGQTLLTLLNDILDLSKVEAGKVELESIAFDPAQIIQETKALFRETAAGKGLKIVAVEFQPTSQRYLGDPYRLRQMISNLVGNAIKFTKEGRIGIQAREINRDGQSTVLEFSVTDTGIGIPEEQRRFLFKPFSQADSSITRKFGGTGLGLSIVISLAKIMGGEAGVDSEPGRGSRFWFRIQAKPVEAGQDSRESERPCQGGITAKSKLTGRILVVEDNETNRKVVEVLLNKIGLTATFAEDGKQALDAITRGDNSDLIMMDVNMPVMDGYLATEKIRQWETGNAKPRRPIIAITAGAYEEDRRHCLEAGMDDALTKPIFLADLQTALSRWLPATTGTLVTNPAARPGSRPMDVPLILKLLRELRPLLEQNQFKVFAKFRELEELLSESELSVEIADIGRQLRLMQFDVVLDRLTLMAKKQDWTI